MWAEPSDSHTLMNVIAAQSFGSGRRTTTTATMRTASAGIPRYAARVPGGPRYPTFGRWCCWYADNAKGNSTLPRRFSDGCFQTAPRMCWGPASANHSG